MEQQIVGQQAQTEQWIEQLRLDLARGIEPINPLRQGQLELEQELARCTDQLHEFQVQLRGARRRLKKLSKNRIIRAFALARRLPPLETAAGRGRFSRQYLRATNETRDFGMHRGARGDEPFYRRPHR